jgi:hypothetical protein
MAGFELSLNPAVCRHAVMIDSGGCDECADRLLIDLLGNGALETHG